MPDEVWLPIPWYEESYEVSSLGKVRSLTRYVQRTDGKIVLYYGRILQQSLTKGYYRVTLRQVGTKTKLWPVHQLVAATFIGPKPFRKAEVRHGDGVKAHNAASNLSYGTRKENAEDMVRHGGSARGQRHPNAKMTDDLARRVKDALKRGTAQYKIAKRHGLCLQVVHGIAHGKGWKHIK